MINETEFYDYVTSGGKVDSTDPMPDAYRKEVSRIMGFQALAEVVGTIMVTQWVPKAPSLMRKLMYTAKGQDEMGHAHILIRQCEDMGLSREDILEGFLQGKSKLLNIFHYGFDTYEEMSITMMLQNTAAIVQFQSLVKGSYLPYARALRKIMKEESFHYNLSVDMSKWITENGTDKQRELMQQAIDTWYPRMLAYFGPSEKGKPLSNALKWKVKVDTNDDILQMWLDKIVPLIESVGYKVNDPKLHKDEVTGQWSYTEPDWQAVKKIVNEGGPRVNEWKSIVEKSFRETSWVREIVRKANLEVVS
jgi:ring-1,2-phenylacetyl-CoA epoxidase subunit PaaA